MERFIEIFTLLTGVIYVILEIRQKNLMWVLGILTSLASMLMFYSKGAYASFTLNVYYLVTAVVGLWQWRRDRAVMDQIHGQTADEKICLRHLSFKTFLSGMAFIAAGTIALSWGMDSLHAAGILKENPMSWLDASIAAVSAVATWWLVRSYLEQWWLWIVANAMSVVLCATCGMWMMALLYVAYLAAAVAGLIYWKKHGVSI